MAKYLIVYFSDDRAIQQTDKKLEEWYGDVVDENAMIFEFVNGSFKLLEVTIEDKEDDEDEDEEDKFSAEWIGVPTV